MKLITKTFLLFFSLTSLIISQSERKFWKGSAIIGGGDVCAVYSDDPSNNTNSKGIQHFYYKDYIVDYISLTSFDLFDDNGAPYQKTKSNKVDIDDFFCAVTESYFADDVKHQTKCYALPQNAVVLSTELKGTKESISQKFQISFRKNFVSDHATNLVSLKIDEHQAVAEWSNGTVIVVAPKKNSNILEVHDSTLVIYQRVSGKKKNEIVILAAFGYEEAKSNLKKNFKQKNLYKSASAHWNKWLNSGRVPKFKKVNEETKQYLNFFKRNLYAVKSANLNGQIPADITGQFLTNNMPQLYPRDAMMSARVFLLTGHPEEAKQVIKFWARQDIPQKTDGEFYARYDANAKAVDGGGGARYDEPEWDANGYFIQLLKMYFDKTGEWLADKSTIYRAADFLVRSIDEEGFLYEGGIVEWTGYLPATNMVCAAGLKTASQIASKFGDKEKAKKYLSAYQTLSSSMKKLFDETRQTYTAIRYTTEKADGNRSISEKEGKKFFLWDTSIYYGIIWGYPDHKEFELSNKFLLGNTVTLGGGMQYFEAYDNGWLTEYGKDAFFFPSAASAQYNISKGNLKPAKIHIDWMINNSNSYGLMPERILTQKNIVSDASPLSWCNAEFALSVLLFSEKYNGD